MNVGTRELKNRLSHYLRLVRQGERLNVCDRGEVVAELRPVKASATREAELLEDLARTGVVTAGRGKLRDFTPARPRRKAKAVSAMLLEDRG